MACMTHPPSTIADPLVWKPDMAQYKEGDCELQVYLTATRNDTYIAQVASATCANAVIAQI